MNPEAQQAVRRISRDNYLRADLQAAGRKTSPVVVTARELDVWRETASGLQLKEIGARLGICKATVAAYRKTLYDKLRAANAVEVTLMAIACGVVALPKVKTTVRTRPSP